MQDCPPGITGLKQEFQSELDDPGVMHVVWMQEAARCLTVRRVPVYTCVIAGVKAKTTIRSETAWGTIYACKLSMVKNIEGFSSEFGGYSIAHWKMLEYAHIEVRRLRHGEGVAPQVPKR